MKRITCMAFALFSMACSDTKNTRQDTRGITADASKASDDPLRPQFHYTSDVNFLSDPNGLVYNNGDFHLFHQFNPHDIRSGIPQHWAHAVSTDLVNWQRKPMAIRPHGGGNIWSGSAVVDVENTSGFQTGDEPPIVAFYTWEKDFSQRMVYSNDNAETWTEYENNPVVPHIYDRNRDPKVFWYEPTGQWIMILYVKEFEIFVSANLKDWKKTGAIALDGFHECPDLFELPVDGDENNKKWVVTDAAGVYYIGNFDGKTFAKETGPGLTDWNGGKLDLTGDGPKEFYATQTWSNMPSDDGRIVQISCMRDRKYKIASEVFHNQMTFPCELTVRTTDDGLKLFRWPVSEIATLYADTSEVPQTLVKAGRPLALAEGDLLDIEAKLEMPKSDHTITLPFRPYDPLSIRFTIRGVDVLYDVRAEEISCAGVTAPLRLNENGQLDIRILVDTISFEIFGNNGEVSISSYVNLSPENHKTYLSSTGGDVRIKRMTVRQLNPAEIE